MSLRSNIEPFADKTFVRFVAVGVVNTIVGTAVMFVCYNVFHLSYWLSTASNYLFGSVCSYLLNRRYTFRYVGRGWGSAVRFTANIVVCWLLAYGIARPLMHLLLTGSSVAVQENVSMLTGMCLFVVFNYLGQRYYTFKQQKQ